MLHILPVEKRLLYIKYGLKLHLPLETLPRDVRARYEREYSKFISDRTYKSDWVYMDEMSFMESYVNQQENFLESISKMSKRDMYCRACLRQIVGNADLITESFDIFLTGNFCEKYVQSTNLKSVPWDEYPHSICGKCYEQVLEIHKFQVMCRESLEKFKILIESSQSNAKNEIYEPEISDRDLLDVAEQTADESANYEQRKERIYMKEVDPLTIDTNTHLILITMERDFPNTCEISTDNSQIFKGHTDIDNSPIVKEVIDNANNSTIDDIEEDLVIQKYDIELMDYEQSLDNYEYNDETGNAHNISVDNVNDDFTILVKLSDNPNNITNLEENSKDEESIIEDCKEKARGAPHKCGTCSKYFKLRHCFEAHLRNHQGLLGYPCTFENCTQAFSRLVRLQEHLKRHSGIKKTYKCNIDNCDSVFSCFKLFNAHKQKNHRNQEKCVKEVQTKSVNEEQPKSVKEEQRKRFRGDQIIHIREEQAERVRKEQTKCIEEQQSKSAKGPKQKKTYACETCGQVLSTLRSLVGHRFIHVDRSQWPFVCEEKNCTRRFRLKNQLLIHKRRHAGIKNYVCPICGVRKTTNTELSIHINFHTFQRKYPCPTCTKVFKSVGSMRTHHNLVHEGKGKLKKEKMREQFKCSYCDRVLASALNKEQHETAHTGVGRVPCDECGKTYPSLALLKNHKSNMHYKGELFCEECGKKCKSKIYLKSHLKTHFKGDPPFACDECGKTFKRAMYLENHKKLHVEGATPFKCDECGIGFRWEGTLYGHKKKHKLQKMENAKRNGVEDDVDDALKDVVNEDSILNETLSNKFD